MYVCFGTIAVIWHYGNKRRQVHGCAAISLTSISLPVSRHGGTSEGAKLCPHQSRPANTRGRRLDKWSGIQSTFWSFLQLHCLNAVPIRITFPIHLQHLQKVTEWYVIIVQQYLKLPHNTYKTYFWVSSVVPSWHPPSMKSKEPVNTE